MTPAPPQTHAVTGAYGYIGQYIARRLLDRGIPVITLTNSPHRRNPLGDQVRAFRFNFEDPLHLVEALQGVSVLYNTYWVRFDHRQFTFEQAVQNSQVLIEAAVDAGVGRIVHVSILNPSPDSPYPYFRGKAAVEQAIHDSGLAYAILRPGVVFGPEDILVNNIAWILRRFPVFGVFGDGSYRLQPVYVEDLADIAVREGQNRGNVIINCVGPETFTFRELVATIADGIGVRRRIVGLPPAVGYWAARLIGDFKGDVTLTRDEILALMDNLLYAESPSTGKTRLSDWIRANGDRLGRSYSSELKRRTDRRSAY